MSDIIIKTEHLSKYYRLGNINNGTFFKDVQSWFALKRGKEDPHSKLESNDAVNKEGFWALNDLNFEIHQGDRVGIIGKNGAGKSTLLKVLSRITTPTEGNVKIKGRVASLLEVGTGFHAELTGRENIYLNGAILGMKRSEVTKKLDEIIDFSEIEKYIDTPVKRYSSGMYVRLAFAVAAHLDSEILIADEVLAVGDATFQKKALGKMNEISSGQGRTVLFVSHQIPAVVSLCNKGIFLEHGKILEDGNLQKCVNLYLNTAESTSTGYWEGSEGDDVLKLYKTTIANINSPSSYKKDYIKGETILLTMDYEIFTTHRENFVFNIEIFNIKGVQLCSSSAADYFNAEEFENFKTKGKHKLQLQIDTSIFAEGEYIIKLDFAIHCVKRFIEENPTLSFSVLPLDESFAQESECRKNIISPNWKWN